MSKPSRLGHAVSLAVLAASLASCATSRTETSFGGKADENLGLATRAMLALNAHNLPTAVEFAERAVEKNPGDAGFRALLGNAYFASGRFASAESAYKDALTIYNNQPQVILKLALAQTALGKRDDAVAFLKAGRSVLNPSDYGLALALAGRPSEAIAVLDNAARQQGADATVRQNLALAHALAGDWTEARTIAQQDVPASALDARMSQWMQLANPKTAAAQVAALVGVTPAVVDQGEPVRLALRNTDTMMAAAKPVPAPKVASAARSLVASPVAGTRPKVAVAASQPVAAPQPKVAMAASQPVAAPQPKVAVAAPQPVQPKFVEAVAALRAPPAIVPAVVSAAKRVPKPVIADAAVPTPVAMLAAAASQASVAAAHKFASAVELFLPKKHSAQVHPARGTASARRPLVAAVRAASRSGAVVQLGAYRSPQYVSTAWNELTKRHPALRSYLPLRARFVSPKGTFWRLSIQGFSSEREALASCHQLKSRGGSCFVRSIAGDAPIQFASR